jgi:hypothetical protein
MPIDRIWDSIKETAQRMGRRAKPLGSEESERIVETICLREGARTVPREALEYLARELLRLAEEGRGP